MWGVLLQLLASAKGEAEAGKSTAEQQRLLKEIYDKIKNKEGFSELQATDLPASEMGNLRTDPATREAQMSAMNKMKGIEDAGGLTLEDLAAQNKVIGNVARQASAGQNRILEQRAMRGTLGSGDELAASLSNQQAGAERANEAGLQTAANAQRNYYQSILGRGKMAGDLRGQDFQENSAKANANDLRNRYNNNQDWDAKKYNAEIPHRLLDAQIHAGGGLASSYGHEADSTRALWNGLGIAGKEAFRSGGGNSSPSRQEDDDAWRYRYGNYDIRDPGDK